MIQGPRKAREAQKHFVSSGLATTAGSLELASPGSHERLDMAAGTTSGSKVLLSLTGLAGSLDQQSSLSSGGPQGQLVKGDDFTSSLENPLASLLSDAEGTQSHLGNVKDPQIVGDGANTDSKLVSVALLLQVPHQAGQRKWGTVDLAHEEPPQDDLVELSIGPPCQEPVELDEKPQVDILGLGLSPPHLPILVVPYINSHDFS